MFNNKRIAGLERRLNNLVKRNQRIEELQELADELNKLKLPDSGRMSTGTFHFFVHPEQPLVCSFVHDLTIEEAIILIYNTKKKARK